MHSGSDEYHSLAAVRLQVVGGADGQNIQSSLLLGEMKRSEQSEGGVIGWLRNLAHHTLAEEFSVPVGKVEMVQSLQILLES